jgi:DNA-binding NtrC family response regulator
MINQIFSVTATIPPVGSGSSINGRLRHLVAEMRTTGMHYQDAVLEFEERYIIRILQMHRGHLGKTANSLGMHRNTLTRALRKFGWTKAENLVSSSISDI